MAKRKKSKTVKKLNAKQIVILLILALIVAVAYYVYVHVNEKPTPPSSLEISGELKRDLKVHFVDVGQGDSIIIEFPNDVNMLIDAGDGAKENDAKLLNYVDKLKIKRFDYLLATHCDKDHIGGMDVVFENYEVGYVFRPFNLYNGKNASDFSDNFNQGLTGSQKGTECSTETYYKFLSYVQNKKCDWEFFNRESGLSIKLENEGKEYLCKMEFLTPTANKTSIAYSNKNDYSPIVLLEYCGNKLLFTGDAEEAVEKEFLAAYDEENYDVQVDVLKVGHHGSRSSSSQAFLSRLKPEYAVISCGKDNKYAHPHQETLDNLTVNAVDWSGATVFRTDLHGNIVVTVSIPNDGEEKGKLQLTSDNNPSYADVLTPGKNKS